MSNGTSNGAPPQESAFSIINTVTLIVVAVYAAYTPLWMFFPPTDVKPEVLAIINQMMGSWGYAFAAAIGFHIGSSRSAKDAQATNRDTLQTLSGGAAATVAATAPVIAAAAQVAAIPAAAAAAPPAAAVAAPPAAERAVDAELDKRGIKVTGPENLAGGGEKPSGQA